MDGEHGRHVRILRHRSPEIGKDICECNGFGGNGRNINTPDIQWPAFLPGDYENGRCMSGAFWDMRTALADNDVSGKILANSLRQIQRGVEPNVAKIALLIDDNPAIISGGDNNLAKDSRINKINDSQWGSMV